MKKLSIGKVSKIVDLPQSVLRYWETVFEELDPEKTQGGTRKYSQEDVDTVLLIKELLYKKKFTIAGAQSTLASRGQQQPLNITGAEQLQEIIDELDEIINDLEKNI
jgi:DNA-binding transcriptional MerR regulator